MDSAVAMLAEIIEDSERAAKYSTEEGKAKFAARVEGCRQLIDRLETDAETIKLHNVVARSAMASAGWFADGVDANGKTIFRRASDVGEQEMFRNGENYEEIPPQSPTLLTDLLGLPPSSPKKVAP